MMALLFNLLGLALALCAIVALVYGGLRLLTWPLLWLSRRRLQRRVLARDCRVQNQLAIAGDPFGSWGWPDAPPPPHLAQLVYGWDGERDTLGGS